MGKRIAITALAVSAAAYVAVAQTAPPKAAPPAKAAATRPAPKLSGGWIPRDGLVSLWSGEGNANDSAGENHGKAAGGVGFAAGRVGQAFKLDGKDDHINCGNGKSLQITGSQTIAMWIKPDRLGVRQNPIAKAYGGEGTMTLEPTGELSYFYGTSGMNLGSGRYAVFSTFGQAADTSTGACKVYSVRKTTIKVGQWTHVALVRDLVAKRIRWYVNGDLVTEAAASIPAAKASNLSLLIGKGYVASNFAGLIDEVAIWNRALRAQEVRVVCRQLSPLARGLVGMWTGDGSAADSLGGHNGQLTAGASYATDRHGNRNAAFSFDGKKGFVIIPDSEALDTDESFTLSAWVKPRVWRVPNLDDPLIVAKWDETDPGTGDYYLCLEVDGRARCGVSQGKKNYVHDPLISKSVAPKNKWTHLAMTFDRGKMKLYVNGKLDASKVSATVKHTHREEYPHDDVIIGAGWNNQHNFDGAIDDVAIWGRALSAREVRGVFEAHGLRDTLAIATAPYVAREEAADRVVLDDGRALKGTILNEAFELAAFFGKIKIPAKDVIGLAPAGGESRAWVLLADGQAVVGRLTDPDVHLKLTIGGKLNIPLSDTRQCGYRITKARPASAAMSGPAVALCSGHRLIWTGIKEQLRLRTPYGEVNLPIRSIVRIGLDIRRSGFEARLTNGSRLSGNLLPEELTLQLKLGPQAKIGRERIYALTRPAEAETPIDAAFVTMRNRDRLIGGFKDEKLTIRTKFGQAKLPLARILRMTLAADQAGKVAVEALIWDQSQVSGLLTDREIALAIRPDGPTLKLPATQVASILQPTAMPPPEIARKIEDLIVRLGADSYVDREAAEKALIKMGKGIVPVLRKHLKNKDPEIRQRVRRILEKLQPPSEEKGGDVFILPAEIDDI